MKVTVVHALADRQSVVELDLGPGATAQAAVDASGLAGAPESQLGIAGRRVQPGRLLEDGDRVEILRPLASDPNEARRQRARRKKGGG